MRNIFVLFFGLIVLAPIGNLTAQSVSGQCSYVGIPNNAMAYPKECQPETYDRTVCQEFFQELRRIRRSRTFDVTITPLIDPNKTINIGAKNVPLIEIEFSQPLYGDDEGREFADMNITRMAYFNSVDSEGDIVGQFANPRLKVENDCVKKFDLQWNKYSFDDLDDDHPAFTRFEKVSHPDLAFYSPNHTSELIDGTYHHTPRFKEALALDLFNFHDKSPKKSEPIAYGPSPDQRAIVSGNAPTRITLFVDVKRVRKNIGKTITLFQYFQGEWNNGMRYDSGGMVGLNGDPITHAAGGQLRYFDPEGNELELYGESVERDMLNVATFTIVDGLNPDFKTRRICRRAKRTGRRSLKRRCNQRRRSL